MGDTVTCIATIHSVPRGNMETTRNPHSKEGSSHVILRWTGSLSREMVPGPTQADEDYCTVNFVIVPGALNSNSTRSTEHSKCQGHLTLIVPGALNICRAMGTFNNCGILEQCLDWYRSGHSFIFVPWSPLQIRAGACLPSLIFIVNDYLVRF